MLTFNIKLEKNSLKVDGFSLKIYTKEKVPYQTGLRMTELGADELMENHSVVCLQFPSIFKRNAYV